MKATRLGTAAFLGLAVAALTPVVAYAQPTCDTIEQVRLNENIVTEQISFSNSIVSSSANRPLSLNGHSIYGDMSRYTILAALSSEALDPTAEQVASAVMSGYDTDEGVVSTSISTQSDTTASFDAAISALEVILSDDSQESGLNITNDESANLKEAISKISEQHAIEEIASNNLSFTEAYDQMLENEDVVIDDKTLPEMLDEAESNQNISDTKNIASAAASVSEDTEQDSISRAAALLESSKQYVATEPIAAEDESCESSNLHTIATSELKETSILDLRMSIAAADNAKKAEIVEEVERLAAIAYEQGLNEALVAAAVSQLGVPYVWGGTTPYGGLDCSGLTQYCYSTIGIATGRTTENQKGNAWEIVPVSQAEPGDILYKYGHVGLYVGDGVYIHAPQSGDVVRYAYNPETFSCALRFTGTVPAE